MGTTAADKKSRAEFKDYIDQMMRGYKALARRGEMQEVTERFVRRAIQDAYKMGRKSRRPTK